MLTNAAFQLFYGRLYKFYSARTIFFCAIALFEIGSAVCGAAPSSIALIIGRAIAGAGSAGVMAGVMQILVLVVPLERRPVFAGLFASMSGVAAVVSPVLAGAFTERVSWRWCFYINLPFAAVSILAVFLLVKTPPPAESGLSFREKIAKLDIPGLILFIPCITCLILPLQWGGSTYAWSGGRIIGLWVAFAITLLAWIAVQWWKKDNATVPGRVFFQRSVFAGALFSTTFTSSMMLLVYYVPTWFQAIKGDSPVIAGLSFIPFLLALVVASILGGIFTSRIGYYVPTMILASIVASIGIGVLTALFNPNTEHPTWMGLQVLCGFGVGLGLQQSILAAQTVLPPPDVPIGMAIMFFGQQLGGAIFLAVGETIFNNLLASGLRGLSELSSSEAELISAAGASDFRSMVSSSVLPAVLAVYNRAITNTWYISLALSCVSLIPALSMEWRNIKSKKQGSKKNSDNRTSKEDDPAQRQTEEKENDDGMDAV